MKEHFKKSYLSATVLAVMFVIIAIIGFLSLCFLGANTTYAVGRGGQENANTTYAVGRGGQLAQLTYSSANNLQSGFDGAAEQVVIEGKRAGVKINGAAQYGKTVKVNGFCSNAVIDSFDGDSITAQIKEGGQTVIAFNFNLSERLEGSVNLGGEEIKFSKLKYVRDNEVQYRIGREEQISTEDGKATFKWVIRVNSFEKMLEEGEPLDKILTGLEGKDLNFTVDTTGEFKVMRVDSDFLYDYSTETDGVVAIKEGISFESLNISWTLYDKYSQKGFIVRRYEGSIETKTFTFTSGNIASIVDKYLDQGKTYTYKITAYDSLNLKQAPCPLIVYDYAELSQATRKGNPAAAIGITIAIIVGIAAVILIYTYWFKIFKDKKEAKGVGKA